MTKIEIHLLFQKESGKGLETITKMLNDPRVYVEGECDACGTVFEDVGGADPDLMAYIDWLEEQHLRLQSGIDAWEASNTIAVAAQKAIKK